MLAYPRTICQSETRPWLGASCSTSQWNNGTLTNKVFELSEKIEVLWNQLRDIHLAQRSAGVI